MTHTATHPTTVRLFVHHDSDLMLSRTSGGIAQLTVICKASTDPTSTTWRLAITGPAAVQAHDAIVTSMYGDPVALQATVTDLQPLCIAGSLCIFAKTKDIQTIREKHHAI